MRRTVAILLILCAPAAARAQSPKQKQPPEQSAAQQGVATAAAPANLNLGAIPGASAIAGQQTTFVQAILDASIKEKVGTAAFGWKTGKRQVQLSFSGPVGSTDEATPISLTGLSAGAKAKLSMNRMFWRAPNPVEQKALVDLCTRLGRGLPQTSGVAFTDEDFEKAKTLPACRASEITNPDDRAMYEYYSHLHAIPWVLGFDGTAGQTTHKFVQEGTLESATEKDLEWSISGRAGFFQQGLGFVLATYSYAESSAAKGPATQICRPMAGITAEGGATSVTALSSAPQHPKHVGHHGRTSPSRFQQVRDVAEPDLRLQKEQGRHARVGFRSAGLLPDDLRHGESNRRRAVRMALGHEGSDRGRLHRWSVQTFSELSARGDDRARVAGLSRGGLQRRVEDGQAVFVEGEIYDGSEYRQARLAIRFPFGSRAES